MEKVILVASDKVDEAIKLLNDNGLKAEGIWPYTAMLMDEIDIAINAITEKENIEELKPEILSRILELNNLVDSEYIQGEVKKILIELRAK